MEEEKRNFNTNHHELKEGEMFLTNVSIGLFSVYMRSSWYTKRKGKIAYTIEGARLEEYAPVFVQRKEYEEGMKKYE